MLTQEPRSSEACNEATIGFYLDQTFFWNGLDLHRWTFSAVAGQHTRATTHARRR